MTQENVAHNRAIIAKPCPVPDYTVIINTQKHSPQNEVSYETARDHHYRR